MSKDERIEKIRYWLKFSLFFVILLFVWLAFEDFFANQFQKLDAILPKENNGLLIWVFAAICLLCLLYIAFKHYRQRVFSWYFFGILAFIIFVCLNYRFNWGLWKGKWEINRDYHRLFDIVLGSLALLLTGQVIIYFWWKKLRLIWKKRKVLWKKKKLIKLIRKKKKEGKPENRSENTKALSFDWLSDKAKKSIADDKYNFSPHVIDFVKKLKQTKDNHSIGLRGDWGSGKTSYMNMIKDELKKEKDKYILVDFNPRHSKSLNHIQKDFFNLLEVELEVYDNAIPHSLSKYLNAIGVKSESKIISFFIDILSIMLDENNIDKRRQKVDDSIKKIGKRIVVFIDDFDRLLCDEILEVLKLIDVNAKFWNVIFISAYDRKQVSEIFEKGKIAQSDRFAEKFFNVEHDIPLPDKEYILKNLKKYLPKN